VVGFTTGSRGKVPGKTCEKRRNNNNNNSTQFIYFNNNNNNNNNKIIAIIPAFLFDSRAHTAPYPIDALFPFRYG
jgi:hypothetical protein